MLYHHRAPSTNRWHPDLFLVCFFPRLQTWVNEWPSLSTYNTALCVRVPQTSPKFSVSLALTRLDQSHTHSLIAMICYSRRIQCKSSKGKVQSEVWRKPGTSFQAFSHGGVTQDTLDDPSKESQQHVWNPVCQGSSGRLSAVAFLGAGSHRQPLPGTVQGSRLPEGKQVFSIS